MDPFQILEKAQALASLAGTRDPVRILRALHIRPYYLPASTALLGMYTYRWDHSIFLVNEGLEDNPLSLILAHELGHACLHRDLAGTGLMEYSLLPLTDETEYEANAFASHLLLDEEALLEKAREGLTLSELAKEEGYLEDLIRIKLMEMKRMGHDLPADFLVNPRFLAGKSPRQLGRLWNEE